MLAKFDELGVKPYYEKKSGKLNGKSFVITGTLESMGRDDAAEKIRALGGTFQTSVGKDTDYLVAGGNIGESKRKKAEKTLARVNAKRLKVTVLPLLMKRSFWSCYERAACFYHWQCSQGRTHC